MRLVGFLLKKEKKKRKKDTLHVFRLNHCCVKKSQISGNNKKQ